MKLIFFFLAKFTKGRNHLNIIPTPEEFKLKGRDFRKRSQKQEKLNISKFTKIENNEEVAASFQDNGYRSFKKNKPGERNVNETNKEKTGNVFFWVMKQNVHFFFFFFGEKMPQKRICLVSQWHTLHTSKN